jgi:hypothetical protein
MYRIYCPFLILRDAWYLGSLSTDNRDVQDTLLGMVVNSGKKQKAVKFGSGAGVESGEVGDL